MKKWNYIYNPITIKALIMTAIGTGFSTGVFSNSTTKTAYISQQDADNVFFNESTLPYFAPHFDQIKNSDFLPAFHKGIALQNEEINAIVENSEQADFENTIVAMEQSGALLNRVSKVFMAYTSLLSNDEIVKIQKEIEPQLTAHNDNIYLNSQLFDRVKVVYENRENLNSEQKRLVEYYYNNFVRAGAELSEADKQTMRKLNIAIAELETQFSQNILNSFKNDTILVANESELEGLSQDEIASLAFAAKLAGKEGYLITLVNTTNQPILSSLKNRELRKKIYLASANRAMDVNTPIAQKLSQLRAQKAKLLGYSSWANYILADQMAKTPQAALKILDDLVPKAVLKAKQEAKEIQDQINKDGGNFIVQPWDWSYYAEKVRKEKFDLNQDEIRPYFEFNTVLNDGLFYAMDRLYGIHFKKCTDLPVWHSDVMVFEIFNNDNSSVGLFYLDPYAREGKAGGAWMDELITQSGLLNKKPIVYNALNIPKPAEGKPTLMTFDEVVTMFHEFGHAAHGLFSNVTYPSIAGTNTPRDFVEFPSQFNEDWDINPEVMVNYAKHYQTGEPIPKALLQKILASHKFNSGFEILEYLSAALLDLEWHSTSDGVTTENLNTFEKQVLKKHGIDFSAVSPRYKANYFSHIFSGGYSAGYYSYIWTEVLAADAFAYMTTEGGLTLENGNNFRKDILSKGYSQDLTQNYINFRGQEPTVDALLKRRGLSD